ncbi:MAG: YqeG family HAD IIIA-type phosphatase [Bacilli bacterium]|nr:YqeG family HAD IIIA-type phosphatase [Bacilli bacterium]
MCLSRKVFVHAKSLFEIDVDFFVQHNVKTLFVDLDNTLDSYRLYVPTERTKEYIAKVIEAGITPIIISNNKGKRVTSYAKNLGLECMYSARKPFARKIKRLIAQKSINVDETMMVGDQLVTDAGMANKANIRMVLTDKIVKEDQWTTHFNRLIDRPMRKHYAKKGKLIDWRTLYGKS